MVPSPSPRVNQLFQPPEEMAALIRFTWWFIPFTEATEIIISDICAK